ncbi:GOLPH3/VPS74 family protein [Streptomyces formicae]|uniref:Putative integral membrane protein n=1 Tax=Streptomyces formicae TaxID=1616117 RepID=A0A291QKK2_9ACTN|nr:GPP34 family phosphoprotein [Streptomyces formicae]ATL32098.1 putative integral membrane protein [Streptomyces formicae]
MHHGTLSLPARLFLLAWNTHRGKITGAPDLHLAVRAGALAELAQRGVLFEEDRVVTPVIGARTGDTALDALAELIEQSRPRTWRGWLTHRSRGTLSAVRDQLVAHGYLRTERGRVLGLFPARRYALERVGHVEVLHAEALAVLHGKQPVAEVPEEDAALVMCAATGKLRTIVTGKDRRRYRDRIDELTERAGGASPELRAVMENLRKALASAISSAEAARASGGGG